MKHNFDPPVLIHMRVPFVILHAQVMSASEIEWVNQYHKEVWDKASPRMSGNVLEWLRVNTAPLQVPVPQVAAQA
jgi:Xaa-Pro aminopeptidase